MAKKDYWNVQPPSGDKQFLGYVPTPSWRSCCRCCTRASSPTSRGYRSARGRPAAILLTGIPAGIVPGFQNITGHHAGRHAPAEHGDPADDVDPSNLGILGGDLAGFPNGRRVLDDVVTIELRAVAGVTFPLVDTDVHAGRRRRCGHRRVDVERDSRHGQGRRAVPTELPVPGRAAQRVPGRGSLTDGGRGASRDAARPERGGERRRGHRWRRGRGHPPRSRGAGRARRSRSARPARSGTGPTPPSANATSAAQ